MVAQGYKPSSIISLYSERKRALSLIIIKIIIKISEIMTGKQICFNL